MGGKSSIKVFFLGTVPSLSMFENLSLAYGRVAKGVFSCTKEERKEFSLEKLMKFYKRSKGNELSDDRLLLSQ